MGGRSAKAIKVITIMKGPGVDGGLVLWRTATDATGTASDVGEAQGEIDGDAEYSVSTLYVVDRT